jgi:hypothetical protein
MFFGYENSQPMRFPLEENSRYTNSTGKSVLDFHRFVIRLFFESFESTIPPYSKFNCLGSAFRGIED